MFWSQVHETKLTRDITRKHHRRASFLAHQTHTPNKKESHDLRKQSESCQELQYLG
ncbi:hypothetical protein RSAG8_08052, partial [Rhizoctonia solani AG-8 WAC10335]